MDEDNEPVDVYWEPCEDNVHIILHVGDETTSVNYMDTLSLTVAINTLSNLPDNYVGVGDALRVLRFQYDFLKNRGDE